MRWTASPASRSRIPLRTDARRQPEAGEVGGEEGDNLSDASVQQREDVEAAGNVRPGGGVPQVGAERDLAAGCGGQEPPARSQRAADQEGADLVLAAIPLGQRRHRVARIVGEHRDDRVDVADVPGVGPARGDVIYGRVTEVAQHRLLGRRGRADRFARPFGALLTEAVDVLLLGGQNIMSVNPDRFRQRIGMVFQHLGYL